MPTLLLVNPAAGRGRAESALPPAAGAARKRFGALDIIRTTGPGDAVTLAREGARAGIDRLLVLGGDGTVHEAANGLLGSGVDRLPALGVIPIGSGNDFARMAGTAGMRPTTAVERMARATVQWFDVGHAWEEYFINSLGVGLDAEVASHVPAFRRWPGPLVYLRALTRAYRRYRPLVFTVEVAGATVTTPVTCIEVGIGRTCGGGFYLTPEARPDDGMFDVCQVRPLSHLGFLCKMPLALRGWHTRMREVTMYRTNTLTLRSAGGPILAHFDGEIRRPGAGEIVIALEPARLPVLRVTR